MDGAYRHFCAWDSIWKCMPEKWYFLQISFPHEQIKNEEGLTTTPSDGATYALTTDGRVTEVQYMEKVCDSVSVSRKTSCWGGRLQFHKNMESMRAGNTARADWVTGSGIKCSRCCCNRPAVFWIHQSLTVARVWASLQSKSEELLGEYRPI